MRHKLLIVCAAACLTITQLACSQNEQWSRSASSTTYGGLVGDWQFGQGSWYGMQLNDVYMGLNSPLFVHSNTERTLQDELLRMHVSIGGDSLNFSLHNRSQLFGLAQIMNSPELNVDFFVHFHDSVTCVARAVFHNPGDDQLKVKTSFEWSSQLKEVGPGHLRFQQKDITFDVSYESKDWAELVVPAGGSMERCMLFSGCFDQANVQPISTFDVKSSLAQNFSRLQLAIDTWKDSPDSVLNLGQKALQTLVNNWRSANGNLKYDGIFPSYYPAYFNGIWAWDSWKHAAALGRFNPDLARNQILCMLEMMDEHGMVADVFYRNDSVDYTNWRNTKPPLAAWGAYRANIPTLDPEFFKEIAPALLDYHLWWYENRDHDGNGFCEYGSTDGTLIAAAWESGMDNAVRFDGASMLKNNDHAWSMDQESVDLNAYLIYEKRLLASFFLVQHPDVADSLWKAADDLQARFAGHFWDEESGYFYDRKLDGDLVKVMGPEGWIPLWVELATPEQADKVVEIIADPTHFNTHCPFPTLDASHPEFNPENGYWRGPVWLDQACFGLQGMRNYGYHELADSMQSKLLNNAAGLYEPLQPIMENYHPTTGQGLNAPHFSWSAAHILMILEPR